MEPNTRLRNMLGLIATLFYYAVFELIVELSFVAGPQLLVSINKTDREALRWARRLTAFVCLVILGWLLLKLFRWLGRYCNWFGLGVMDPQQEIQRIPRTPSEWAHATVATLLAAMTLTFSLCLMAAIGFAGDSPYVDDDIVNMMFVGGICMCLIGMGIVWKEVGYFYASTEQTPYNEIIDSTGEEMT